MVASKQIHSSSNLQWSVIPYTHTIEKHIYTYNKPIKQLIQDQGLP